ncbi:MAG TPA: nucleotidyltransferase family protein [Marinobacter sp.]|nr:nucleotidyltransferase family protein [Marinobacter sp.]
MQQTLMNPHFPALVLAAGASTRLGRPKQTLQGPAGETLLDIAIANARLLSPQVWVVAGSGYPLLRFRSHRAPLGWWFNPRWSDGLAASLQEGLGRLDVRAKGAFVLLADQPFLDRDDLETLGQRVRENPREPLAARYGARVGAPAWLPRHLWPACDQLRGDAGAGAVLNRAGAKAVEIAGVAFDIDTPADWRLARKRLAEQPG